MDSGASRDGGASWGANSSWDTPADPSITSANGNHAAKHASRGPFDAAFTVVPDPAERTEPAQDEDFSWLDNSQPEAGPAEPADRGFAWLEREEGGLTSPERTDFWATPAASASTAASADLQLPAQAPRAEEPAIARASWPAVADTATTSAAEPAQRATTGAAPGAVSPAATAAATAAQPLSAAGSAGSAGSAAQAAVSERADRRRDQFFPVRLLAIIVIAALIGSALVLLLK